MTEICMGQWIYLLLIHVYSNLIGIFVIVVTPARIAQYSYDKARLLAATPFGWLAFGLLIGKTQSLYPFRQSLILYRISVRIFSTSCWSYNPCHVVWIRIRYAGLLHQRYGVSLGISFSLCRSSSSFQQKTECMVKQKSELAGIRICSCKLYHFLDFEFIHKTVLIEG